MVWNYKKCDATAMQLNALQMDKKSPKICRKKDPFCS